MIEPCFLIINKNVTILRRSHVFLQSYIFKIIERYNQKLFFIDILKSTVAKTHENSQI